MHACAGTAEGGAGASVDAGMGDRISSFLRGRRSGASMIQVQGVGDAQVAEAAEKTEGFSGKAGRGKCGQGGGSAGWMLEGDCAAAALFPRPAKDDRGL